MTKVSKTIDRVNQPRPLPSQLLSVSMLDASLCILRKRELYLKKLIYRIGRQIGIFHSFSFHPLTDVTIVVSENTYESVDMKNFGISMIIAAVLTVFANPALSCTQRPERVVLEHLLNLDIQSAEASMVSWPDNLTKRYYDAMVSVIKTYNGDNGVDEVMKKEAISKLGKVIRTSEKNYSRKTPENSLILSMSRMYRAGLNMTLDKGATAYNDTYKSQQTLKELTKDYPDFNDAWMVMGMFELFLSNIPPDQQKKAKNLLQISGDKQKGLDFLERAVQTSGLTAPEAARVILMESNLEAPEVCRYRSLATTMKNRYLSNDLLNLTERIINLKCNIAEAEGQPIASDQSFLIHEGCN